MECYSNPACERAGHAVKLSGKLVTLEFMTAERLAEFGFVGGGRGNVNNTATGEFIRGWIGIDIASSGDLGGYGLRLTHEMGHWSDDVNYPGYLHLTTAQQEFVTETIWDAAFCFYATSCGPLRPVYTWWK